MTAHIFLNNLQAKRKGMLSRLAGEKLLPSLSPAKVSVLQQSQRQAAEGKECQPCLQRAEMDPREQQAGDGSRPTIQQELPLSRHPKKAPVRAG